MPDPERPTPGGRVWLGRLAGIEALFVLLFSVCISVSISGSEIAFLTAAVLRVIRWIGGDRPTDWPRALGWAGLALVASWTLSGFLSPEPWESVTRVHRLYQVGVVFLLIDHARTFRTARRVTWALCLGTAVAVLYGYYEWFQVEDPLHYFRLDAFYSVAMTTGNVFAMSITGLLVIAAGTTSRLRWVTLGTALLSAPALLLTQTRSSWIGAALGLTAGGLAARRWKWVVAMLLLLALAVAVIPPLRARAGSVADLGHRTVQGRISLWRSGLEVIRERPITGWGLADQSERIEAHRRADATFYAGHFHSNVVHVAVTTGLLGLVVYLTFHGVLLWLLWRRGRASPWGRAAIGVWFAFHVSGLFDWSFGDAEVAYVYFWWMGVGLAGARERAR